MPRTLRGGRSSAPSAASGKRDHDYENYDTLLAVLALRSALGAETAYKEFPRRALFDRIAMRNTIAGMDRFGHYVLSSQVYTKARDLGRLGLLYLNRGKWNGEQILPESSVDFVRTPAPATRDRGREYGGHWWLVPDRRTDLPQDAYSTNGGRGQYAIVVPSYRLVIVRRGLDFRTGGPGPSQWDLLAEIIKAFPRRTGIRSSRSRRRRGSGRCRCGRSNTIRCRSTPRRRNGCSACEA